MVQVCGRVPKQYLEGSEVGYLRFLTSRTQKTPLSGARHNFLVTAASGVVVVYLLTKINSMLGV